MKVLMVNKFLYPRGGAETYVLKLGEYLSEQGHEVQYFGMEDPHNTVGNAISAYTSNMEFRGRLDISKATYPFKTIYSAEARQKIRQVLDQFAPDVVHINNFTYQLTPSILLEIQDWRIKHKPDCRIVFTAHDSNLVCPNHLMQNPNTGELCTKCLGGHFYHCTQGNCIHGSRVKSIIGSIEGYFWKWNGAYRYLDAIISCSDFMKERLKSDPQLADKITVLHNFVEDIPWKGFAPEKGGVQKRDYVLYFGRYSEEKGIRTLLKVAARLPRVNFVFAGGGPLENEISGLANVHNVGFQSGPALEKLIREARFSICPSECYENCPFSVMESLKYGTPVIGSKLGGIPELIEEGVNGELFEAGNAKELEETIASLWNDRARSQMYARNCQKLPFDTIKEYYEKLLPIYQGK